MCVGVGMCVVFFSWLVPEEGNMESGTSPTMLSLLASRLC